MELLPDYNEKFNISVYYHNNKPAYTIDWNQSLLIRNHKSYPLFKVDNNDVQTFEKWLNPEETEAALKAKERRPTTNTKLPPLEHDANPLSISPIGLQPNEFVPINTNKEMINVGKISPILNPIGKLNEVQTELDISDDEKNWETMIAKVPNTFKKKKRVRFKGNPFSCKDCGKNYSGASGLWYHNKQKHNSEKKKGGRKSRKKRRRRRKKKKKTRRRRRK
jgi:hypothetical protein